MPQFKLSETVNALNQTSNVNIPLVLFTTLFVCVGYCSKMMIDAKSVPVAARAVVKLYFVLKFRIMMKSGK